MKKQTSKTALLIHSSTNAEGRGRSLGRGDGAITHRLESLGYHVTSLKSDGKLEGVNLNDYTLIYLSSVGSGPDFSTDLTARLLGTTSPLLVADEKALDVLLMSKGAGGVKECKDGWVSVNILADGHSLAAGMMDHVVVIGRGGGTASSSAGADAEAASVVWATPRPSAVKVAALPRVGRGSAARQGAAEDAPPAENSEFVLFGYVRNSRLAGRTLASSRRVACFFNDKTAPRLTEDGWALFDAAVNWAVGEELKQFAEVFREEWQEVRERRRRQVIYDDGAGDKRTLAEAATPGGRTWEERCHEYDHPPENLVGLALSGGGIRSATFNLGLLQGLNRYGMLRLFDYVSTVSGGGYLGGWWSAWLARGGAGIQHGQNFYPLFNPTELKRPDDFVDGLLRGGRALADAKNAFYAYLRRVFDEDRMEKVRDYDREGGSRDDVKGYIVEELNKLIAHGGRPPANCQCRKGQPCQPECLYDPQSEDADQKKLAKALDKVRAASADTVASGSCSQFSQETLDFLGAASEGRLGPGSIIRLNRRLLEEILREELGLNLFPGDERIEPVRSAEYFRDRVRRGRRYGAESGRQMQRLIEERKFREENAETAKELLSSGQDPIHHLRLFSNYLTPRKGMMSADTWRAAAAVTRNLALTWLTLVPIIFAAVLAGQLYFSLRPAMTAQDGEPNLTAEQHNQHYINLSLGLPHNLAQASAPADIVAPELASDVPAALVGAVVRAMWAEYPKPARENPVYHDFIFPYPELIGSLQRERHTTEAKLQAARVVTNRPGEQAAAEEARLEERSKQLAERIVYTRDIYHESLSRRFWFALWPVGLLAAWMVLLTCVWMTPSIGGMKKRNLFCGLAVALIAGFVAFAARPWHWVLSGAPAASAGLFAGTEPRHLLWFLTFLIGAAGLGLWLFAKWRASSATADDAQAHAATRLNWCRSALGTGVIRAHTLLLALTVAAALVLALAGFGHDLIDYVIYSDDGWWTTLGRWAAFLTTALTVCASIFTAIKGTPKGGGEELADDKPSLPSRLIFAITPPAVLLVLTIGVSWLAHKLLWVVACQQGESLVALTLATLVGIALCLCFSVLETKWRRSVPIKWAWLWVTLSITAGAALLRYLLSHLEPIGDTTQWLGNSFTSPLITRDYLLLPMLVALGLALTRAIAEEVSAGERQRLFTFAPLNWLLSLRKSRPYLNRLELFGLGLLLSALAAAGLFIFSRLITSLGLLDYVVGNYWRVLSVGVFLTGILLCWLLTLLELRRGTGNNRRALNVLFAALVTLSALLLISFVPRYEEQPYALLGHASLVMLATSLGWVVALGWLADPNMLSMHLFYKSRLVRAYLGASNPRRQIRPREITESVEGDDVLLSELRNCQRGAPYHLVNTTLNLAAGRDLTTAQRSSANFVLSKHNCGSSRTGYRRTENYMGGHLTLGTAVAASGAAASPSMGSRSPSSSLAMLMTILNVRLGFWAPTPNKEHWRQEQPQLWPFYLLREFLSQTNDLSSYSYLTDGGHFDNIGLYSLVERGCRFIVVADCGADTKPCFQDLGEAIRRCRIDFGTEIKLNFEPLVKNERKRSAAHFVVGSIRYRREHLLRLGWPAAAADKEEERYGVIAVVKPALVDDEPPDVRQYGLENGEFPQQSTADQWFDEAQFESYRRFGQYCAKRLFGRLPVMRAAEGRRAAHEPAEATASGREAPHAEGGRKERPKVSLDVRRMAIDGSPLALSDIEVIFDEAYERFRSREMKSLKREKLRQRLAEGVARMIAEEAEREDRPLTPTKGFQFYLDRLIDSGVSMLQSLDDSGSYIEDTEQNIRDLVKEVIAEARKANAPHLHEHFFFVAKGSRHIFPFAAPDENGHK